MANTSEICLLNASIRRESEGGDKKKKRSRYVGKHDTKGLTQVPREERRNVSFLSVVS